jgi:catechol 2,3-dioxygenase-like lactoylglutathione lyase family enzyme
MLDHIGLDVQDYEHSRSFYEQALAPLGLRLMMEPIPGIGGFGDGRRPFVWIGTGRRSPQSGVHVAFEAG